MNIYVAKPGESLKSVCERHRQDYISVAGMNELNVNTVLAPGQTIILPDKEKTKKIGRIEANGYVLPNTPPEVVAKTIRNLSSLSVYCYHAEPDGKLTSPNDDHLTALASSSGLKLSMVVTNLSKDGFDSELASGLLNNRQACETLIGSILAAMKKKGYSSLTIDFEYIPAKDREAYNDFILQAADAIHKAGFTLTTALAPKTSGDVNDEFYEAHDYRFHGQAADRIVLMTYEWGYSFSPPMPVAPLPEIRKVLDYAVSVIPSEKISLLIPNYGYDWTLPYQPERAATAIGNFQAAETARLANAKIEYDERAQAPYFRYFRQTEHEVWFEDARSIRAKLDLIREFNLAGASYWTLNRYFPQCWMVQNGMYDI